MPDYKLYEPRFKSGQIVYYNGKHTGHTLLKTDTPYRVTYCVPKTQAHIDVHIKGPGIDERRFQFGIPIGSEYLMTLNDYMKTDLPIKEKPKEKSKEKKFKQGDKVYYIGREEEFSSTRDGSLNNRTIYTVEFCGLSYLTLKGLKFKDMYDVDQFILKSEKDKTGADVTIDKTKHNFKEGDTVYYDAVERRFEYHKPYRLWGYTSEKSGVFGIYVDNILKPIPKDVVNKDFISEEEYKRKYGVEDKIVGNYKDFTEGKAFKKGDKIYYMGDAIQKLKADTPYEVNYYNPLTGFVKIDNDVFPDSDFISEEKYKELNDEKSPPTEKGREKSETGIKMQIYKDTKSGKLKWGIPYSDQKDWYRAKLNLDNPPGSYLRIDVKKIRGEWEMAIYFHRSKPPTSAENNSVVVRHFKESATLTALIRRIRDQIDEILDELIKDLGKGNHDLIYPH